MNWPPRVGDPLPRAGDAWCAPEKWANWILAERGHGTEWGHVFHVEVGQRERIWEAIAKAVIGALVETVRNLGAAGLTCAVPSKLTLEGRTARVNTA